MEGINIEYFLQMSPEEFDQSPNGWRSFDTPEKHVEAANLIKEYIYRNKDKIDILEIMYFHIGQLLASAGPEHHTEAIQSFKLSFQDSEELWNAYVSATIGFLENDIKKIQLSINIIEKSNEDDKRGGHLGIVKNFKKALEAGRQDYYKVYSELRD